MRRRKFIRWLGSAAFAWPIAAHAQQSKLAKIPRIGYLAVSDPASTPVLVNAFRSGLEEEGLIEGRNIVIEYRWADDVKVLSDRASELVRLPVDLIVAWGTQVVAAARKATSTIPIVMVSITDPVTTGFIASWSRPGGNITGTSNLTRDLSAKLLEILKEVIPSVRWVAVLRNPDNASANWTLKETENAARRMDIQLKLFDVKSPYDFESAFSHMAKARAKAVLVLTDALFVSHSQRIGELALKYTLPMIVSRRENADIGGLLSYGPSLKDLFHQSAGYVAKILNGAKPADLPVAQPTKLELVVNLKTSRALGVKLPPELLSRADEVIE